MAIRRNMYDILKEMNVCSPKVLAEYDEKARSFNKNIGTMLLEDGKITEDTLCSAYSKQTGIQYVPKIEDLDLSVDFIMQYKIRDMKRLCFLPCKMINDSTILLAVSNPNNMELESYISEHFRNVKVRLVIAKESSIYDWLDRKAGSLQVDDDAFSDMHGMTNELPSFDVSGDEDDAKVVKIVNQIFYTAITKRASDIHIAPQVDGLEIRLRLDGMLKRVAVWPMSSHSAIMTRIKMMADMDIAETRRPQGGRIQLRIEKKEVDIRVSTLPTVYGEKATLRILDKSQAKFDITMLGMLPETEAKFRDVISKTSGIVLVTGPTGSGKSTSLYAAMSELNKEETCIITLEDPVEYKVKGLVQVQMNPGAGLDFAAGLREVLRQDPDIVLIGEIRDGETAGIATQASNTGHLVFATLHTNDAPGSVIRLIEMGVEPFMVSSTLLAAMNQRLVRRVCPKCKKEYMLGHDKESMRVRQYMGVDDNEEVKLYKGTGCDACNGTGYKGRLPIQEMLIVNDDIKEALSNNATPVMLRELAIQNGMDTLKVDGIKKALLGLTSIDEIRRVIS